MLKFAFRVRVTVNVRFKVTFGLELGLGMSLKLVSNYFRLSLKLDSVRRADNRPSKMYNVTLRVRVRVRFGVTSG